MKKILTILLSILIISCSDKNKPILAEYELIGNVKSVKNVFLKPTKNNSKFDTISIKNSKFNSDNKKTQSDLKFLNSDCGLRIKTDLFYNSKGKLKTEKSIINHQDNLTSQVFIDYTYQNDKLKRIESFVKEKSDTKKRIIQIENMNYENGILKSSIEKDIEPKLNDTVYTQITKKKYDENQRVIEIVWNVIDIETGKYEFIRSANGLVKETKYYNNIGEPEISYFKYEFDKNGSWITKREYKEDTLNSIRKRIIEYR